MGHTKKVGYSGRYGVRYGAKIREKIVEIERTRRAKHTCPNCAKPGVKRVSSGIWLCKKCGQKFAGKAYKP
jgi:large subunit ribosomal protein L37Ae